MPIRPRAEPRRGSPQTSLQVRVNLCLRTLSGLASAKIRMQQNLMRQEHRLVVCSWDPARRPQQFELRKRTGQHGRPIESQLTKGSGILAQRGCGGAGKRDASDDEDSQGGRPGNRVLRCTDREIDSFPNGTVRQGRVVIASGANRVSEQRMSELLGEQIEKATPEFVRESTGFGIVVCRRSGTAIP